MVAQMISRLPQGWPELDWDRLDPGIRDIVRMLYTNGIETTESCEGTQGHCYPEPTVCFTGDYEAGFRALALCYVHGLKVNRLSRVWSVESGEPKGPEWRLTFYGLAGGLHPVQRADGFYDYEWGQGTPHHRERSGVVSPFLDTKSQ